MIGAHMPAGKGLGAAVRAGKAIGCEAVQIFTSSPQMWRSKPATQKAIDDLNAAREETGIQMVVSHDSYLVNLASPEPENRAKSREALQAELERCGLYGIPYVVSHIGAGMGQPVEVAIALAAEEVRRILATTDESVTLLAETTAGQGSSLNSNFDELAALLAAVDSPRLAVCWDTCHLFAAGYALHTEAGYQEMCAEFDAKIGLDRVRVIHFNDSAKPFASRRDRHAALGEGEIGAEALARIARDPRWVGVPLLLETPDAETMHAENLARLAGYRAA